MISPATDEPRVLLVADDPLARAGLAAVLADEPGCTLVGQISGQDDLLAEPDVYRPQVVLWDLGWDPTVPLEPLEDLRDAGFPVVALVQDEARASEALAAGARGLLLRDVDAPTLAATLRAVGHGLVVFAPQLTDALRSPTHRGATPL